MTLKFKKSMNSKNKKWKYPIKNRWVYFLS